MASSDPAQSRFRKAREELDHLLKLLALEREAERREYQDEWLSLPLDHRMRLGVTLHPVRLQDAKLIVGERWKLRCGYGTGSAEREGLHKFSAGQSVELFRQEGAASETGNRLTGVLAWIGASEFEAVFDELPEWLDEDGKSAGLDLQFNERTYDEMDAAVERVRLAGEGAKSDQAGRILARQRDLLLGYAAPPEIETKSALPESIGARLNAAQRKAVEGVLASPDFAVVHGPPGTGKTTTIVAAVEAMVARGETLLVTAPTNAAVDLLTEKFVELGLEGGIVRLGHPARVGEAIHRVTLDGRVERDPEAKLLLRYKREAEELYREARRYRRNFGAKERAERRELWNEHRELKRTIRGLESSLTTRIIENAKIVLATLVGANHDAIRDKSFDAAVLDEATQALEGAAWIPLSRAPKVVLAGDHKQLPPTVKSAPREGRRQDAGGGELAITLFEKAVARHPQQADRRIFFLDTQYRMSRTIMGFSNAEFYEGRLQADASIDARPPATGGENDLFASDVIFVDTAGCEFYEERDPETESLRNPGEARLLHAIYQEFEATVRREAWSVGWIAPYRAQTGDLRRLVRESYAPEDPARPEANTIDSFQGAERDWIGISLVRCNDEGETGFLSDVRRMNVAMTRARRMLVLIGDSATLSFDPFYARLMEYVEAHGEIRSGFEFS